MRRRLAVSLFAGSLVFLVLSTLASSEAQPRSARRVPQGLRAHEWGVWKIRRGQIEHLEALAAETPAFVFREGRLGHPQPPPPPFQPPFPGPFPAPPPPRPHPPRPHPGDVVARTPILFLCTHQPVDVTVLVAFRGGGPWLHYPSAIRTTAPEQDVASHALTWLGRVANARAPLAPAPRGHWWNDLRAVGASTFISRSDQTAERFLFYDGPVAFEPAYRVENGPAGPQITPLTAENQAWVAQGDMRVFRRTLERALVGRGLTRAEARSLLDTWRDELFRSQTPRVVYLVPRATYDRMLPIRISPQPAELVRVGLVIEEVD